MDAQEKINEIERILNTENKSYGKIGIGVNVFNRHDMFKKCIEEINKYMPPNAVLVSVDDGSEKPVEGVTFRFDKNKGVAIAKNKTIELLYKAGCEHIFLFDEDTYPMSKEWWKPYVESPEPHLNYIFENFSTGVKLNDTTVIYKDKNKIAYSHVRGCMIYLHRSAIDVVGGMCPSFGRYSYEHPHLSDRIFNAGLTSFRFMDVIGSNNLIWNHDEHNNNSATTVKGDERRLLVQKNKSLYDSKRNDSHFIPFYEKENLFLSCYFTSQPDPQGRKFPNTIDLLLPLIKSVKQTRLVILHDNLPDSEIEKVKGYNVTFEKVETSIPVYHQRWVSYREYLMKNKLWIENVMCLDGTDTEILKEPRFREWGGLYVGDEPQRLNDSGGWMKKHHTSQKMQAFLNEYGDQYQLLNAGVVGGDINNLLEFMRLMVDLYCEEGSQSTTDMAFFNYVCRMHFNDKLTYGREITTTFKKEERNDYSYIRHK